MVMQLFNRNAEVKLVEALNSVSDPSGWYALHFHLSDLLEQFKSEYQIKIAVNLINDLLKNFDGGVFVLADSSIIVIAYGLDKTLQSKLIFQLRYLYMDDPLAYDDNGQENPQFCTSYDLKQDWQKFLDLATKRMAMTVRRETNKRIEKIEQNIASAATRIVSEEPQSPSYHHDATVSSLTRIDAALNHLNIENVMRRQTICAMQKGLPPRKLFDEIYVHISQLVPMLADDKEFISNRWLFRYLTHILDQHMLAFLQAQSATQLVGAVSLNMNIETLLSDAFQAFDKSLPAGSKSGIVLEVPVVDAFADMTGFTLARKEAQRLGYRVCLDGVTSDSFTHIQRDKLGVDLVKVQWNVKLAELGSPARDDMIQAVKSTGANRIILCRCDDKTAIDFGHSVGIALFQGRYVDMVINPNQQMDN